MLKSLFEKLVARGLPLLTLVILSYTAANSTNIDALFFETSIREVGVFLAILSAPFLNSLVYGQFKKEIDNYNDYLILVLIIIVALLLFTKYFIFGILLGNALLVYYIRYKIIRKSLAIKKKMSFKFTLIYFGCLTLLNSIFLISSKLVILNFTFFFLSLLALFILKEIKLKKIKFSLNFSKTKQFDIFLLSISTLLLNNIDLFIVNKISLENQEISLAILYTKRLIILLDLIVITFIQTSTFKEIKLLYKKIIIFTFIVSVGLLFIYPFFFDLMKLNLSYSFLVSFFIILSAIKSITIIKERNIIESFSLNKFKNANLILVLVSFLASILFSNINSLIIILFLVVFAQIIIRFMPFKTNLQSEKFTHS